MSSQMEPPAWRPMPRSAVRSGDLFWGVPGQERDQPVIIAFAYGFTDDTGYWVATSVDDLLGEVPEHGRAFAALPFRASDRELLIERPAREDWYAAMRRRALDRLGDRERTAAWLLEA